MSDSESLTVGGQTSFDMPLAFRAQAAIVNNLSNQWVELLDANDTFVPPYIVNMIVPVGGATRFRASFAAPTGIAQAAVINGQRVTVEVYETALQPSAGQLFPVRAPSTEWRNPKEIMFSSIVAIPAGSGFSADWSYTVPVGRRARLDSAQTIAEISVSDGVGAGVVVGATIQEQIGGVGSSLNLITSEIINGTALGARADAALATSFELAAGDVVSGVSGNPRAGASSIVAAERAHFIEGDA